MALNIKYKWKLELRVPLCHKWFSTTDPATGRRRIAVCDDSGELPDQTDDGLIWLDQEKPITVDGTHVSIPGLRDGGRSAIIGGTNLREAKALETLFGMEIQIAQGDFTWMA